jgi:uncharacterized membrane protein (DUF2068 family)
LPGAPFFVLFAKGGIARNPAASLPVESKYPVPAALAQSSRTRRHHDIGLLLIAAYKFLGAIIIALVGFGALHLIGKDVGDVLATLVINLRFNPESRFVNFLLDKAELLSDPTLRRIGFAAFCYAGLGILEGIGLYLEKIWGEYLTLLITASFLPWEIRELMHRVTGIRIALFAMNVAVLVYLVAIVYHRHWKPSRTR